MDNISKPSVGAKDFFLHLGAIVGLYWGAISFIQLVTEIINYRFPDALSGYYNYGYSGTMRYAIASLIIVFPIYLLLSWLNQREIAREPAKKDLWIRKWLLMVTLFVAGITVVVDLVVFLNTFLGGEITTRFVLKALTVLIVALGVFGYYIWEIRTTQTVSSNRKLFAGVATIIILLALILGFVTVGSPSTQRAIRFDEQRVADLQNIQWQVVNYWQSKGVLPANLEVAQDSISGWKAPVDPEAKSAYEYKITGALKFQLCANFNKVSLSRSNQEITKPMPVGYGGEPVGEPVEENWSHEAGKYCFDRTIDPQFYPVRKNY